MVQAGVHGAGINEVSETHLLYPAKTLVEGMPHHFENQRMVDGNKSINRVIDDFLRTCAHIDIVKRIQSRLQI
jgi:hypothetical protein